MIHSLSFFGSVNASSRVTLVSSRIGFPYIVKRIRCKFALGHNGLVQHKFFIGDDDAAPTTGEPSGINILEQWGYVDYVVGDDDVLDFEDNTPVPRHPSWVKVLGINTDSGYTHTINVVITIDDLVERPDEKQLREMIEGINQGGIVA